MATAAPQTNGIIPSSSQPNPSNSPGQSQPAQPNTSQQPQPQIPQPQQSSAPRPRDARTLELLLTAQGVTAYEPRVPVQLLDFAYRHTSAVLSDALHLAADPYTSQAGSRPSATSGAAPVNVGDAAVSANAVRLAIASRLGYQFRGGSGAGGVSKDWMMELARDRNRVALPPVPPEEWGVRLPNERFVLGGVSWGLKDQWVPGGDDSSEEEDRGSDAMEGVENTGAGDEEVGGEGVEGGTMADVFGDELGDEEMAE